jgi:hypothetical protein
MEGYSVARRGNAFVIYRGDDEVARISPLYSGKLAFDWHDRFMWRFSPSDFVAKPITK